MRWTLVLASISVLAGRAGADPHIDQLVKGYERELTSCRVHEGGVANILDGASMLLERSHEDGLAEDVKSLHAAHEAVASYCTAVASTLDFLRADPSASYKSIDKQIDQRDNHIRTLRASSKKALDDTQPLIQRWIPKINAARIENDKSTAPGSSSKPEAKPEAKPEPKPEAKPEPKPEAKPEPKPEARPEPQPEAKPSSVAAKFPSGRAVKLPQLGGKWEVRGDATTDVAEHVSDATYSSVVAEAFAGSSCASQLARLQAKAYGRHAIKEQARAGQAWLVRVEGDTPMVVACASTRTGSAVVTFDAPDASHPDLAELAWAMLAAMAK
jgi:hypothetical protein